jgi:DNA gyrase subunit A
MAISNQRDRVLPRLIEDEMRESFIDYSMSVIVQRALPDVRDGLKPVHRRILFAMQEAGLVPGRPYKKSATVVGDVLGKYHPHGDSAVYDSLVRMVQDFSLRYPLVDGQGNFGSIDGDSAAAYRYTEARLTPLAMEVLADIEKETVDFSPNFDDRLQEPQVLPARVPNLLVNGSSGIAVGMSTNIPPHNVREIVAAAVHLLDHPECTVEDLMAHVPGPDFPTGGLIVGTKGIRDAYETGRGRVVMRGRVYKEQRRGGREQLVVTEIPYGTNKSRIIEQVADLTRQGKLHDIADLRDESDRDGIRVVIELKRGADAAKVLAGIYKGTGLQTTFGVIALALDRGVPREFSLKAILERYRDHRIEVVVRRSNWELAKARDEAHVLQGLMIALRRIDDVVRIIRASRDRDAARRKLEKELKLTERQSEAILNMRLSRLTQLEGRELKARLAELETRIGELEALLASPEQQVDVIRQELLAAAERFGDPRRTTIFESEKSVRLEDMLAVEEVVLTLTREGYVKQIPMPVYQRRMATGRGLADTEGSAGDWLAQVLVATTDDTLLALTADGRAYGMPVRDVPEAGLSSRGRRLHQLLELPRDAGIAAVLLVSEFREDRFLLFATAEGSVKRTTLDQYARPRAGGVEAMGLRSGDRVIAAAVTDGETELVLAGSGGRAIRFEEGAVPPMGRTAQGVRGIKLGAGERVVGMAAVRHEAVFCAVTERGFARRLATDDLPLQKRDGKGTPVVSTARAHGPVVGFLAIHAGEDLMALTAVGRTLRMKPFALPAPDEGAEPVAALEVSRHDKVIAVAPVAQPEPPPEEDTEDSDGGTMPPDGSASPTLADVGDEPAADLVASADAAAPEELAGDAPDAAPPPEQRPPLAEDLDLFG